MDDDGRRILTPIAGAEVSPAELFAAERPSRPPARVGVALSGGGIRSATLSLGFFQGLSYGGLLRHVDYLSTVSGGSYFGGFFGHLFQRTAEALGIERGYRGSNEDVVRAVERKLIDPASPSLRQLRENGRYLSPNGAGDLLSGAAAGVRNWLAVLLVMGVLALFALALVTLGLFGLEVGLEAALARAFPQAADPTIAWPQWLSPLFLVAAFAFVAFAIPPGWAYWLVRENPRDRMVIPFIARWLAPIVGAAAGFWAIGLSNRRDGAAWVLGLIGVLSALTILRFAVGDIVVPWRRLLPWLRGNEADASSQGHYPSRFAFRDTGMLRRTLSRGLARALMMTGVFLAMAIVDSVGRLVVLELRDPVAFSSAVAGITALAGILRRYVSALSSRFGASERPPVPTSVLVHGAAIVLLVAFLGAIASVPNVVALGRELPPTRFPAPDVEAFGRLAVLVAGTALAALAINQVWSFINRSSLHAVYEARLRRAYLGASNPKRFGESDDRPPITEPDPDDGFTMAAYDPAAYGGPVHLINVTVNETVDGRSQIEQKDRKGLGMAIGPAGVSVGRTHHALWKNTKKSVGAMRRARKERMSEQRKALRSRVPFRVFPGDAMPEQLDVGQWIAISGAAFSTGIGSRTNLGLSLLSGFFNVRLGYWWSSGVDPNDRVGRSRCTLLQSLGRWLRRALPVQASLLDEWLARFPGVARKEWYLSDGGHFENLGLYELIRRRLPFIIVCDNEQDTSYRFAGLANLVRKARIDFDTDVDFLSQGELDDMLPKGDPLRRWIGPLPSLERGRRSEESVKDPSTGEERIVNDRNRAAYSLAHAALARIAYPALSEAVPRASGWLLYVKPTLVGDEPVDIGHYHAEHPDFPHESTADQFFDEAQWESYRRLGEHLATKVFARPAASGGWSPWREMTEG